MPRSIFVSLSRAKNDETLVPIKECSVPPLWAGSRCKGLQLVRRTVPGARPASLEMGLLEGTRHHQAWQMGETHLQDSPGQPAEQQQGRKGGVRVGRGRRRGRGLG